MFRGVQNASGLLPGLRHGSDSIDSTLVKRISESQSLARDTMRIDPIGGKPVEIVGVVRERSRPDLTRRYRLERSSIGFNELAKAIGGADPIQLTVMVDELAGDPDAVDFFSYTFLLPPKFYERGIDRGVVIQARLFPLTTLSGISVWLAQEIERLH